MAKNKPSFILYRDIHSTIKLLTDHQAGQLFKHILSYVNDEHPELTDLTLKLAFEPIKQSLKRDLIHWESVREIRSETGRLGGLAKQANARSGKQKLAKPSKSSRNSNSNSNGYSNSNRISNTHLFYKDQIKSIQDTIQNERYSALIEFIYGKNTLNRPLKTLLNYSDQLTFIQYENMKIECQEHGKKLFEVLLAMEDNKNPKKRQSIYLHGLNFIRPRK